MAKATRRNLNVKSGTRKSAGAVVPANPTTVLDRPVKLGNPRMGWASDAIAEVTRRLNFKYMALVPGASYRGFHDSIVNYLGNENPQMLICLHEEHSVAIADGYARVADTPMAVAIHTNVGLMHACMTIFCAWEGRAPIVMFGANGPIDANIRRPWIDWIHSTKDHAQLIRNFIKWDDEPQSAQAAIESVLRANQIARSKPYGPTYVCLDAGLQEEEIPDGLQIPDVNRYLPAPPPAADRTTIRKIIEAVKKAKLPVMLLGRGDRSQEAWDNRVKLAEALGCAVVSQLRAGSIFPTQHPSHVVVPCMRPNEENKEMIRKADLLLNLGWFDFAGFLRLCTGSAQTQKPIDSTVVNVSLQHYMHNGWNMDYQALSAADINVAADPDTVIRQMLEELGVKGKPTGKPKLKPAVKQIQHWTKSKAAQAKPAAKGTMEAKDFHLIMSEFVCNDPKISLCHISTGFPGHAARWTSPLDFSGNDSGGGVGSGPGQSLGCALAYRDAGRVPVTMLGDGDFSMGSTALWTASRMRIPLLVVVMNNRSYFNDEAHQHHVAEARNRPVENRWIGLRIDDPAPNVIGMAKAQGFDGENAPVKTVEEFRAALKRGHAVVAKGGRYIIDAWIEKDDAVGRRSSDGGRGENQPPKKKK